MNIRIILSSIKILIAITIESVTTNEYANGSFFPGQEKNTQINYFKFSKFVLHLHTHTLYRIVSSPALPFRYRWLNFLSNRVPFMHTHRPSMIHIVRLSEQHQHTKEWKCACVCAWFTFNPFNEWWNFLLRYNFTHSTCFPPSNMSQKTNARSQFHFRQSPSPKKICENIKCVCTQNLQTHNDRSILVPLSLLLLVTGANFNMLFASLISFVIFFVLNELRLGD